MKESKKTVLIVDDDVDYLVQMEIQVKKLGYDVVTADTQKQGEELISKQKFDLAIIDLMMENKDSGFILCYKMKQQNPSMPVIIASAVTAETGVASRQKRIIPSPDMAANTGDPSKAAASSNPLNSQMTGSVGRIRPSVKTAPTMARAPARPRMSPPRGPN